MYVCMYVVCMLHFCSCCVQEENNKEQRILFFMSILIQANNILFLLNIWHNKPISILNFNSTLTLLSLLSLPMLTSLFVLMLWCCCWCGTNHWLSYKGRNINITMAEPHLTKKINW